MCKDIEKYEIKELYDIILLTGLLHFLPKNKCLRLLKRIKKQTCSGGLNILDIFLVGSSCQEGSSGYYFEKNGLLSNYSGWKVIKQEHYTENDGNHNEFAVFQKLF